MIRDDYMRRRVAETVIGSGRRRIRVSTVRLHSIRDYGPEFKTLAALAGLGEIPEEWETMVSGGPLDGFIDRSETRGAAKITHEAIALAVRLGVERRKAARAQLRRMHAAYRARWA